MRCKSSKPNMWSEPRPGSIAALIHAVRAIPSGFRSKCRYVEEVLSNDSDEISQIQQFDLNQVVLAVAHPHLPSPDEYRSLPSHHSRPAG